MSKLLKKFGIILVTAIMFFSVLTGCGSASSMAVADSDDWRDMQVMVCGTRLKDLTNMTVSDLKKQGFKVNKLLYNINYMGDGKLNPGESRVVSFTHKNEPNALYDFKVVNNTGKVASLSKCSIMVVYNLDNGLPVGSYVSGKDIELCCGIKLGMTSDEVRAAMGEDPTTEKIKDNSSKFAKQWEYYPDPASPQKIFLAFSKDTDYLNTIMISCN